MHIVPSIDCNICDVLALGLVQTADLRADKFQNSRIHNIICIYMRTEIDYNTRYTSQYKITFIIS